MTTSTFPTSVAGFSARFRHLQDAQAVGRLPAGETSTRSANRTGPLGKARPAPCSALIAVRPRLGNLFVLIGIRRRFTECTRPIG